MKDRKIEESAKRISDLASSESVKVLIKLLRNSAKIPLIRKSGIHIPQLVFASIFQKRGVPLLAPPAPKKIRLGCLQKISISSFSNKRNGHKESTVLKSALEAHLATARQDLHLFKLKQIYEENHLPKRTICGWKLPKSSAMTTKIQSSGRRHKNWLNTPIKGVKAKKLLQKEEISEEDKRREHEQLDLQKRLTEKHYYASTTRPSL